jgi:predicted metal-binding membrane protein
MMVAMMLPSLVPTLWRYRQAVGGIGETRLAWLTALVAAGYFVVWTALGMAIFPLGIALAAIEMRIPSWVRTIPIAAGWIVLIAGVLQFTAWKARQLACCRATPVRGCSVPADFWMAWRHDLCLRRRGRAVPDRARSRAWMTHQRCDLARCPTKTAAG